jgi:hypothetical protein
MEVELGGMHANINYELHELERILASENPGVGTEGPEVQVLHTVATEVERIKRTLVYEVFHFEDERHLERYIQYHQQALIRLIDKTNFLMSGNISTNQHKLYGILYNAFDELLTYVERHFTKYFDQDVKAPDGYLAAARKDAQANIERLQKSFMDANADERLVELLFRVVNRIIKTDPEMTITYRNAIYAKEMQKELFRVIERHATETDIDEELRQVMYYLNYNSVKVLTYHAHHINALLDTLETRGEKIEKLSFILKNINQAQVKPGIAYNLRAASLKSQLGNYISEELDYHERLQQLSNRSSGSPGDGFLEGFKLKFEASVSQLAYLIRVLVGTKIILNNNLTQVIQFLVRFVITKKSEALSYASFRTKFYNVETGTKQSVRNMLLSMIHFIDKD